MRIHVATISEEALNVRSRESYYGMQKKLFIVVIAIVSLMPLALQIWLASREYRQSWIAKTSGDLSSLAMSRRETIELFLKSQEDLLTGYVELYRKKDIATHATLERVFSAINKSGVITDLGVIDKDGTHLAYVGPFRKELIGRNYSGTEWFRQSMQSGRYVSDVLMGYRETPHQVIAVTDRERTWVLRATINSAMFNGLIDNVNVGPGGDAYIINRKGELQTPSRLGIKNRDIGGQGLSFTQAYDYITAVEPLKGGEWLLVLRSNVDISLAEFYKARKRDMMIMGIAGALVLIVATMLVRSMVGKIEEADLNRASLNDRVRQAEKMALVGRIAASVAHEINNPLQIIGDRAGLLGEMLGEERAIAPERLSDYEESVSSISKNVKRASTVTHRLLGFSRKHGEDYAPTDINRLIEETIGFLQKEAEVNRISITKQLSEIMPETVTDACQLQQVFLNVLNNAVEAIGRDGSVTVKTSITDGEIIVEFADSGPGLPAERPDKIFDPFFSTKNSSGTGLGLSISFNIMQRLGGKIMARNSAHRGSVFTVCVPLVPVKAAEVNV